MDAQQSNRSVDTDAHRQRATRRAGDRAAWGALPVRAGHRQRKTARSDVVNDLGLPDAVFEEIRKTVHGYNVPGPLITAAQTAPVNGRVAAAERLVPISSSHDTLFTSGTLGRYSKVLHNVMEGRQGR